MPNFLPIQERDDFLPMQSFLPKQGPNHFLLGYEHASFLPGQLQSHHQKMLSDQIISKLKSDGVFDQFRRQCISDGNITPAYRNLSQRVEANVMAFLSKQTFRESLCKNQLRERLRRNITESGILEANVGRIVDQVVDSKVDTVFRPKVQEEICKYLENEKSATATNNINPQSVAPASINAVKENEENIKYLLEKFETNTNKSVKKISEFKVPEDKHKFANSYKEKRNDKNDSKIHNKSGKSKHENKLEAKPDYRYKNNEGRSATSQRNDKEREKNEDKSRHKPNEKLGKERSPKANESSNKYEESLIKTKSNNKKSDKNHSKEKDHSHKSKLPDKKRHYYRDISSSTNHGDKSVSLSRNKNKESSNKDAYYSKSYGKHSFSNTSKPSSRSSKDKDENRNEDYKFDKLKVEKTADYHYSLLDGCSEINSSASSGKVEQKTKRSSNFIKSKVIKTRDYKAKSKSPYAIETRQSRKNKAAQMANNENMR